MCFFQVNNGISFKVQSSKFKEKYKNIIDKIYIYLKGAEVLGEKPEDIVVFEDSYFCIKTAKEAGFKVCAVYDESNKKYMDDTKNIADYYFEYKELNRGE